ETFAGVVDTAVALGRRRQGAMRDFKLGEGHLPQGLAHRLRRIETIGHKKTSQAARPPASMIPGRGVQGQAPLPCGRSVEKFRHGEVAESQFCVLCSGSSL